jgi:hypothetical protein
MKKSYSWFLRFYGLTDSQIKEVIKEIREKTSHKFSFRLSTSNCSVNFIIPNDCKPVKDATCFFNTKAEGLRFAKDEVAKRIYEQNSIAPLKYRGCGEVVTRHPKDLAWGVK